MTSLPASDPGSAAVWGSKRIYPRPQFCLCLAWSGCPSNDEDDDDDEYVLDLRNRLEATTKLAQEELRKNQIKNMRLFDRKAKRREFKVGDKVLVLLPTSSNKLLMHWRGPYTITKQVAGNNYKINTKNKFKTYHANMLKPYFARSEGSTKDDNPEDNTPVVTATATIEEEEPSVEEECLLTFEELAQNESVDDVKIGQGLTQSQK